MATGIALAYYENGGNGVTGLTPLVTVYRVALANLAKSAIVSAQAMTEIGDGLYAYRLTSLDFTLYWYPFVAKAAGETVDAEDLPGLVHDFGQVEMAAFGVAVAGDAMTLADDAITSAKFDESTAFPLASVDAGSTQVARVGADGDTLETLSDQIDVAQADLDSPDQYKADVSGLATPADVNVALAVSETEAETVATGALAITLWHTFSQTVSSTVTADISAATKLWWAVKLYRESDTDAESLVFVEQTSGLTRLARGPYSGESGNGSISVSGSSGDWSIALKLEESVTGDLISWKNKSTIKSEVKALVNGDTINVWSGLCTVSAESVRAIE